MFRGLLCFLCLPAALSAGVIHVVPGGGSGGNGTQADPFRNLPDAVKAAEAQRKRQPGEELTLSLAGGAYVLSQPLRLSVAHSGEPGRPFVIRPAAGQRARLSLGQEVAMDEFRKITDPALLARVSPEAKGGIGRLSLAEIGVKLATPRNQFSKHDLLEVFHDGRRLPMSCWPNHGYARMGEVLDKGLPPSREGGCFRYQDARAERWLPAMQDGGVWLRGFWRVPWTRQAIRVKEIDRDQKTIRFAESIGGGIGSKYGKAHAGSLGEEQWQAINLLEEIDMPGEWSANPDSNTLYLWPPSGSAESKLLVCHLAKPVVEIAGASDVTLREIEIDGSLGHGVSIEGGSRVSVAGCRIRNVADCGVHILGGSGHLVVSNDISETGREGVRFTGGVRKTLTPGGHRVSNNHIHHTGVHAPVPAITAGEGRKSQTVGNTVSRNRIHDVPNAGIVFGGNDNLFECNEIYRVGLGSSDLGGIYTNSAWTARGNIIRHNFIHHSLNANAIYMDDGSCGSLIEGNLIWKTGSGGFIGGGHDQTLRNNLILECPRGMHLDSRGVSRDYSLSNKGFADDLASVPYTEEPWKSRYPALVRILETDTRVPRNIVMEHNVIAGCETAIRKSGRPEHFKTLVWRGNVELPSAADFIDEARMSIVSPLPGKGLPAGFKSIPLERIGLYQDSLRKEIPPRDLKALREKDTSKPFDSQTDIDASNRR